MAMSTIFCTVIWVLALFDQGSSQDKASIFKKYTSRLKLATLLDSTRLETRVVHPILNISRNYLPIPPKNTEVMATIINFILLQRKLKRNNFFNRSYAHSTVGISSDLIAGEACRHLQELISSWYDNFNCTTDQLQDISWQIQLYKLTDWIGNYTWKAAQIFYITPLYEYDCAFWNTRIAGNCTGLSERSPQSGEYYNLATLQMLHTAVKDRYEGDCNGQYSICDDV